MKFFLFIICLCFVAMIFPSHVSAHGVGMPPYARVNGSFAVSNPLQLFGITSQNFLIPQDIVAQHIVVNEPSDFVIDQIQLESLIAKEFLSKTTYTWDFGDGVQQKGLSVQHTYQKPSTYFVTLTIQVAIDPTQPSEFVDSYLVTVVPFKSFTSLPQARMKVNDKSYTDERSKVINSDFRQEFMFDARDSIAPYQIVEYLWDFGDGTSATGATVKHTYKRQYYENVVLRITDVNNFVSYDYVGIKNVPEVVNTNISQVPTMSFHYQKIQTKSTSPNVFLMILGAVILLIGSWFFQKRLNR